MKPRIAVIWILIGLLAAVLRWLRPIGRPPGPDRRQHPRRRAGRHGRRPPGRVPRRPGHLRVLPRAGRGPARSGRSCRHHLRRGHPRPRRTHQGPIPHRRRVRALLAPHGPARVQGDGPGHERRPVRRGEHARPRRPEALAARDLLAAVPQPRHHGRAEHGPAGPIAGGHQPAALAGGRHAGHGGRHRADPGARAPAAARSAERADRGRAARPGQTDTGPTGPHAPPGG
jgi:hypothetical protein